VIFLFGPFNNHFALKNYSKNNNFSPCGVVLRAGQCFYKMCNLFHATKILKNQRLKYFENKETFHLKFISSNQAVVL